MKGALVCVVLGVGRSMVRGAQVVLNVSSNGFTREPDKRKVKNNYQSPRRHGSMVSVAVQSMKMKSSGL